MTRVRHLLRYALALLSLLPAVSSAQSLEGRLWSTEQRRFVTWAEFYDHWLPQGGWLIVGETHDNPDHHRIEAELIGTLAQRQQLGPVALEMATSEQQAALDTAQAAPDQVTPEQLSWSPGWDWQVYQAPVQAALRHAPRVLGADLSRPAMSEVYRNGAPDGELEPAHADFMRALLNTSHCGQLPASQLDPMRQVQLARDQQMASVLRAHTRHDKTGILLTGSIHARSDLGVPRWLGTIPVISLLLQSLESSTVPEDYIPTSFGNLKRSDLILFTPAVEAPDYCEQLSGR